MKSNDKILIFAIVYDAIKELQIKSWMLSVGIERK
jgi:hypothetical protein